MSELTVGAHVSMGGNPPEAVAKAAGDGLRSMQIFASSPAAWKPPILRPEANDAFVRARLEFEIDSLFIHSIYLINLASLDPILVHRSRSSLLATLQAGKAMQATGVVTHIGSHAGRGFEAVAEDVATGLHDILQRTPSGIDLILETSAGSGGIIGADLRDLGILLDLVGRHPQLKIGLDTAHLFASGWDFTQPGTADRLVDTFADTIGLERLAIVHANDSKQPCGSRKDRHANIGEGFIGLAGFKHLLAQRELRSVPWVLETPNPEERHTDIRRLRESALTQASHRV